MIDAQIDVARAVHREGQAAGHGPSSAEVFRPGHRAGRREFAGIGVPAADLGQGHAADRERCSCSVKIPGEVDIAGGVGGRGVGITAAGGEAVASRPVANQGFRGGAGDRAGAVRVGGRHREGVAREIGQARHRHRRGGARGRDRRAAAHRRRRHRVARDRRAAVARRRREAHRPLLVAADGEDRGRRAGRAGGDGRGGAGGGARAGGSRRRDREGVAGAVGQARHRQRRGRAGGGEAAGAGGHRVAGDRRAARVGGGGERHRRLPVAGGRRDARRRARGEGIGLLKKERIVAAEQGERRRRRIRPLEIAAHIHVARAIRGDGGASGTDPAAAVAFGPGGIAGRVELQREGVLGAELGERRRRQVCRVKIPVQIHVAHPVRRDGAAPDRGAAAAEVLSPCEGAVRGREFQRKGILDAELGERRRGQVRRLEIPAEVDAAGTVHRDAGAVGGGPAAAEALRPRGRAIRAREFHGKGVAGAEPRERRHRQVSRLEVSAQIGIAGPVHRDAQAVDIGPAAAEFLGPLHRAGRAELGRKGGLGAELVQGHSAQHERRPGEIPGDENIARGVGGKAVDIGGAADPEALDPGDRAVRGREFHHHGILVAHERARRRRQARPAEIPAEIHVARTVHREAPAHGPGPAAAEALRPDDGAGRVELGREGVGGAELGQRHAAHRERRPVEMPGDVDVARGVGGRAVDIGGFGAEPEIFRPVANHRFRGGAGGRAGADRVGRRDREGVAREVGQARHRDRRGGARRRDRAAAGHRRRRHRVGRDRRPARARRRRERHGRLRVAARGRDARRRTGHCRRGQGRAGRPAAAGAHGGGRLDREGVARAVGQARHRDRRGGARRRDRAAAAHRRRRHRVDRDRRAAVARRGRERHRRLRVTAHHRHARRCSGHRGRRHGRRGGGRRARADSVGRRDGEGVAGAVGQARDDMAQAGRAGIAVRAAGRTRRHGVAGDRRAARARRGRERHGDLRVAFCSRGDGRRSGHGGRRHGGGRRGVEAGADVIRRHDGKGFGLAVSQAGDRQRRARSRGSETAGVGRHRVAGDRQAAVVGRRREAHDHLCVAGRRRHARRGTRREGIGLLDQHRGRVSDHAQCRIGHVRGTELAAYVDVAHAVYADGIGSHRTPGAVITHRIDDRTVRRRDFHHEAVHRAYFIERWLRQSVR